LTLEDDLVASGRYLEVEIRRPGGSRRRVVLGFVPRPDGAYVVGAGTPDARWPELLAGAPDVNVRVGELRFEAVASEIADDDPERVAAIRELILRYGTPSEGIGRGPLFRLTPI
jgi:hypothetical protein